LTDNVEGIAIVERIADDLGLTWTQKGALFGYEVQREDQWRSLSEKLIRSVTEEPSQDVQDRVNLIIEIKTSLDTIFGPDSGVQQQWLAKKQETLDGQTPLDLLSTRHQHGLAHILGLLQRVTG
jgi:uncharacterized protein (DUF2384 family)